MCSTIRPLPLHHCFGMFQRKHVCKAPTSTFHQGLELPRSKVCWTIRPLPLRHCFGLCQRNRVRKAPTSIFHRSLELPRMVQPVSRAKGQKCARLSTPSLCKGQKCARLSAPSMLYHCFALFQRNRVCKAPTNIFHQSLELPRMVQPVSRSKGQKCARLSAPSLYTTVLVCFKGTVYGKPQPVSFTRALNCQEWSNQFREPRVKSVLDYPPPPLPLHH